MTKKYSSVLKVRKWKEDGILNEMGNLNRVLAMDKERLTNLKDVINEQSRTMTDVLREGNISTLHEVGLYSNYLVHLSSEVKKQERLVAKREKDVECKRQELGDAAKDRKVVETLQDKAFKADLRERARKEQREVEDVSSSRHKGQGR